MSMLDLLFRCQHRNLSRVFTLRPIKRARLNWPEQSGSKRTYRVCLDCSRELAYDWQEMKIISTNDARNDAAIVGNIESQR